MKERKPHKLKYNPYLEKLYFSNKPIIIYKVLDGYNIYTDFSKKIILTKKNVNKFFNLISKKNIQKRQICLLVFLDMKFYVIF